jgi:hypothetical protein
MASSVSRRVVFSAMRLKHLQSAAGYGAPLGRGGARYVVDVQQNRLRATTKGLRAQPVERRVRSKGPGASARASLPGRRSRPL